VSPLPGCRHATRGDYLRLIARKPLNA
jgi:hypothetical protein